MTVRNDTGFDAETPARVADATSATLSSADLGALNRRRFLGGAAATALAAAPVASLAQGRTYVIGGKAFTEQYVLAEITKQLLERAGFSAVTRVGYATDAIREAQIAGQIDISWDYTWTGYAFHHEQSGFRPADDIVDWLREVDRPNGLMWLERSNMNNTYALAVNLDFAAEACIHSIPDLARAVRNGLQVRLASDQECHRRVDCWLRAKEVYDFSIPDELIQVMNVSDTYEALRERRADVAVVYTTDGKIPAYDLELLEDPEAVFAEYFLIPVIRTETQEAEPRLEGVLNRLSRSLDAATFQDLHYRIDIVGQPIDQVARYFITIKGL